MNETNVEQERANELLKKIGAAFHSRVIGQDHLLRELFTGLIGGGHVLIEGVPGLGKTLAAKTLAGTIQAEFKRIQFTPDLLPSDITGTMVFSQQTGDFYFRKGPVFTNILLADEINRAPGKVQSALLEAMEERQVTIGDETYPLPNPFFVIATQNPIEHEGTYNLPEAQVDRFFLKILLDYPTRDEELQILGRYGSDAPSIRLPAIDLEEYRFLRSFCAGMHMQEELKRYVVSLIRATRPAAGDGDQSPANTFLMFGASPRGALALQQCSKIFAFLSGRNYVLPEDIKEAALPVLRHRILLSYEAESEGLSADVIIRRILETVAVP